MHTPTRITLDGALAARVATLAAEAGQIVEEFVERFLRVLVEGDSTSRTTGMHLAAAQSQTMSHPAAGWLNIKQAAVYSGRSQNEIRRACQDDPLTGKPKLTHSRGGKGAYLFTEAWLNAWNLRRVRHSE
jgi:hypothetical protein